MDRMTIVETLFSMIGGSSGAGVVNCWNFSNSILYTLIKETNFINPMKMGKEQFI